MSGLIIRIHFVVSLKCFTSAHSPVSFLEYLFSAAISLVGEFQDWILAICHLIKVCELNHDLLNISLSYIESFDKLGSLIASYPLILNTSHFVFVPGPLDISSNLILPHRRLPSRVISKLKSRIPRARFMSNPCRIKCFGQEIVVFREDAMARMLRNLVGSNPQTSNDELKKSVCARIFFYQ